MAALMKRLRKDGRPTYTVLVRLKGHPARTKTFDRKSDAERWGKEVETDLRRAIFRSSAEAERLTVAELVDGYLAGPFLEVPQNQQPQLRARLLWWRDALGRFSLTNLRPKDIAECKKRLLEEPVFQGRRRKAKRSRGPSTVNRYLSALSNVYRWARSELHLEIPNLVREVSRLREPDPIDEVVTKEEQVRWLEICRSDSNPRLYLLAVLFCATGARIGELENLLWSNVDLRPGREHLFIRRGSAARRTTKNKMLRAVPIGWQPLAVTALRDELARRRPDVEHVFPREEGPGPAAMRHAFNRSIEAAGLRSKRVTPHRFRHTLATQLAEVGFTHHQLMSFFGWKSSRTADRYIHARPQRMLASFPMEKAHEFSL